jgi:hypothetical protein
MVAGRSWTTGEFRELFVSHPLLCHLARRLVWLCVPAGASERALYETPAIGGAGAVTAFRVAEDRTFADVRDEEFTLPKDASVRPAHPLHLGEELAEWGDLFADHEILQPFPQLGRAVHRLTDDEAAGDRLERFENITVSTAELLGLERRGWERDEPMFAGAVDVSTEQSLEFVGLSEQPSAWDPPGEPSKPAFAELDPVAASELLADLTELVAR